MSDRRLPAILHPYDPAEAIGTAEAARRAGMSERTLRDWCTQHHIGRKIGGRRQYSQVALDMHLAGDSRALEAYLAGDRASKHVRRYFEDRGITLPDA